MVSFEIKMVELCIKWNEIIHSSDIFLKNCNRIQNKGFLSIKKLGKNPSRKSGKNMSKLICSFSSVTDIL